jgi:hypothetical protein
MPQPDTVLSNPIISILDGRSPRHHCTELAGVSTWITSREDLILSKLIWAREANSELQKRDVLTLLEDSVDWPYLTEWAAKLGLNDMLEEVSK